MTPSAHTTPSTPHRLLVIGGAGFMGSRMATHLLRRRCDIVTFGSRSTAYRDVAPGSEPLPLVAKESARRPLQTKPTQLDLKNIVEVDWKQEKTIASQSHNA